MNFANPSDILFFIQSHGYFILFLVMFFEGPIVTITAAFASSLGIFNIWMIIALSIFGSFLGDIFYFSLGFLGRETLVKRWTYFSDERIRDIEHKLDLHAGKTITAIKLTPLIGGPALMIAGAARVPLKKFLFFSFLVSFVTSLVFASLGFYFGIITLGFSEYFKIGQFIILFSIVFIIALWYFIGKLSKKIAQKIEKV